MQEVESWRWKCRQGRLPRLWLLESLTLDLSHVRQASHREAEILAVQGTSNGLAHGGLPHSWRAHQAQNLSRCVPSQLANCNELKDAVLHVTEPIVILIQNLQQVWNLEL